MSIEAAFEGEKHMEKIASNNYIQSKNTNTPTEGLGTP